MNAQSANPFEQYIHGELLRRLSGKRSARSLFLWGAGQAGRNAMSCLQSLAIPFDFFVDSDSAKQGTQIMNHKVVAPGALKVSKHPFVLITSMFHKEISAALRTMHYIEGRDFAVFSPEDLAKFSFLPLRQAYAIWWAGRSSSRSVPILVRLPISGRLIPGSLGLSRETSKQRDLWCCVVDREADVLPDCFKHVQDTVTSSTRFNACAAAVEIVPHSQWAAKGQSDVFLLRWLLALHTCTPPVICQLGHLLDFCHDPTIGSFDLASLNEWLRARRLLNGPKQGPVVARYSAQWAELCIKQILRGSEPISIEASGRSNPLADFINKIGNEGGIPISHTEVISFAREFFPRIPVECGSEYLKNRIKDAASVGRIGVLAHSRGNSFFVEIQTLLAEGLRRAGVDVFCEDEQSKPEKGSARYIVVAPHEFFVIPGSRGEWFEQVHRMALLNTEQPSSRWFSAAIRHLFASPLVFDMNWQTCMILRLLGRNAHYLPLGYVDHLRQFEPRRIMPSKSVFDHLSRSQRTLGTEVPAYSERPIDVLFVGSLSERREKLFAQAAPVLADYECFLHIVTEKKPILRGDPACLDSRDMADLCSRSKILLNVHRDETPYFEWHRIVLKGIWNGAVVVTEPVLPVPGFTAGEDYLECEMPALQDVLRRLLRTQKGAEEAARISNRARKKLVRQFRMQEIVACAARLMCHEIHN